MIVRLSGGLGNQLFQYAFGRAITDKNGEELFLDDFAFKRDNQREYALEYYNIKARKVNKIKQFYYNCIFYANRKLNFIDRGKARAGLFYEHLEFSNEDIRNTKAEYFEGCWQNQNYFSNIKDTLQKELVYSGNLSHEKMNVLDFIRNNNVVAVHVRHGDYLKPVNQQMYEIAPLNYYVEAMKYLRKQQKDCMFCFFSDDLPWCKTEFGTDDDCLFFDEIADNSAQEDLFFMSNCKHFIIANSSFSWWASYLSLNEEAIKIAPKRWFKMDDVNTRCKEALLGDFIQL